MRRLIVRDGSDPTVILRLAEEKSGIDRELEPFGIRYEHWETIGDLPDAADPVVALDYYVEPIARLEQIGHFSRADVVYHRPDDLFRRQPKDEISKEHYHDDDEAYFVAEGTGSFWFNFGDHLVECLCERGDLLFIAKKLRHWFHSGSEPNYTLVRVFKEELDWVAHFTGGDVDHRPLNAPGA